MKFHCDKCGDKINERHILDVVGITAKKGEKREVRKLLLAVAYQCKIIKYDSNKKFVVTDSFYDRLIDIASDPNMQMNSDEIVMHAIKHIIESDVFWSKYPVQFEHTLGVALEVWKIMKRGRIWQKVVRDVLVRRSKR